MLFRDLITAALVGGVAFVLFASGDKLPIGSAVRMGPGFVPRAVAIGLLLVAAGIAARGIWAHFAGRRRVSSAAPADPAPVHWRGAASIGIGILAFAALIQPIGLVASATVTVFVSSLAQRGERLPARLALAGGLAAVSTLVFALALGLPLPILPAFP